ncbi:MAG TPA: FAD-dependent oxidoreductase [Roseiflexaceae bacterium]|nr:FAD-dependent oxidoreductase [Roseiflexaceae bacterium]
MHLAIVGAGVAGLAAARALRRLRFDVDITIYEQDERIGGRVATGRRAGFAFDHGAQVIKTPSPGVERLLLEELPAGELRRMALPVWTFDASGAISPGDPALNAEPSWYYAGGNDRLAELLAEGLNLRRGVRVDRLNVQRSNVERSMEYYLRAADGSTVGVADVVLLTPPAPLSAAIVAASDIDAGLRDQLLAELRCAAYRRCVSLALAYDRPLELPFYALVNADRAHPIAWLALEHAKGPERCPPGHSLLVAQMAPGWSEARWDAPTDAVAPEVARLAGELLGADLGAPLWWERRDWRHALPDAGCDIEMLNRAGGGLLFAGDYGGQGRVHLAIESGWRVARWISTML